MRPRQRLQQAAAAIAARHGRPRSGPWRAFSKLLLAPRWTGDGVRAPGLRRWKAGELLEWATAGLPADRSEEWGDVGYYVAQTSDWLWWLYERITPAEIVDRAVAKFERRAERSEDVTHI